MSTNNRSRLYVATDSTAGDTCFSDKTYKKKVSHGVATQWDAKTCLSGREQRSDTTVDTTSSQDSVIATEKLKDTILSLLDVASRPNNVARPDPSSGEFGSWMDLALDLLQSEELRVAVASWVREQLPHVTPFAGSKGELLGKDQEEVSSIRDIVKSFALGCPTTMMNNYRPAGLNNESIDAIQTALQNLFRRTIGDKKSPEKNLRSPSEKIRNTITPHSKRTESRTESTQTSPIDCGPVWRFPKGTEGNCTREIGTIANVEDAPHRETYIFRSYTCEDPLYEFFSTTRATQTKASEPEHWSSRVDSRRSRVASHTLTMTTKRFTFRPCRATPAMCVATAVISRATQTYRPTWEEEEEPYFPPDDLDLEVNPTFTMSPRRLRPTPAPYTPHTPPDVTMCMSDEYGSGLERDYDYTGHIYHNRRMEPSFVSSGSYTHSSELDASCSRLPRTISRRSSRPTTRALEHRVTYRHPPPPPPPPPPPTSSHVRSRHRGRRESTPKTPKRHAVDRGYIRAAGSLGSPRQRKKEPCRSLEQVDQISPRVSNADARTILADITRCLVNHCNENYHHHDTSDKGKNTLVDDYLNGILVPPTTAKSKQGRPATPCEMMSCRRPQEEGRSVSKASRVSANGDFGPQTPCTPSSVTNSHKISSSENERNYVTSCRITSKFNRSSSLTRQHGLQSQSEPSRLHHHSTSNAAWGPMKIHKTEETQTFRKAKQRHGDNAEKCVHDPANIPRCPANASLDINLYDSMEERRVNVVRKSSSHTKWNVRKHTPGKHKGKNVEEVPSDLSEARALLPTSDLDDVLNDADVRSRSQSITGSSSSCEDSRIYFAHDSNLGYRTTEKDSELFSYSDKDPSLHGSIMKKVQDQVLSKKACSSVSKKEKIKT